MNIIKIFESWKIAYNPDDEQIELAKERLEVCHTCPHATKLRGTSVYICEICGCPLNKKIYTPLKYQDTCDLDKWRMIDKKYKDIDENTDRY